MQDRRSVRGALLRGSPIEVVVEDRFDRAVSARADVDGALGGGFEALGAIRTGQPDDPQTGAKALFRVPTLFEDQFTQRRSRRADQVSARMRSIVHPRSLRSRWRRASSILDANSEMRSSNSTSCVPAAFDAIAIDAGDLRWLDEGHPAS